MYRFEERADVEENLAINWASSQENLSSEFPTKWNPNQLFQLQRLATKLKFHS